MLSTHRHIALVATDLDLRSFFDRVPLVISAEIHGGLGATVANRLELGEIVGPSEQGGNAGHVPMAGPGDDTPIEVGIDLTPLLEKLGPDKEGKGKLFIRLTRADGSKAEGELHECAVRSYDPKGQFLRESQLKIKEGKFGDSVLKIDSIIRDLVSK